MDYLLFWKSERNRKRNGVERKREESSLMRVMTYLKALLDKVCVSVTSVPPENTFTTVIMRWEFYGCAHCVHRPI